MLNIILRTCMSLYKNVPGQVMIPCLLASIQLLHPTKEETSKITNLSVAVEDMSKVHFRVIKSSNVQQEVLRTSDMGCCKSLLCAKQ